jgi:hypothetical protein
MAADRRLPPSRPEDCATAWFAVLERARLDQDRRRVDQALAELRRLGVTVVWDADERQEAPRA